MPLRVPVAAMRASRAVLQCAPVGPSLLAAVVPPPLLGVVDAAPRDGAPYGAATDRTFRSPGWRQAMLRLYRTVLKAHEMYIDDDGQRVFGDKFVKAEFHRHMVANERISVLFYKGWCDYVGQLERGAAKGRSLSPEEEKLLSPEQRDTLRELRGHVAMMRSDSGGVNF